MGDNRRATFWIALFLSYGTAIGLLTVMCADDDTPTLIVVFVGGFNGTFAAYFTTIFMIAAYDRFKRRRGNRSH